MRFLNRLRQFAQRAPRTRPLPCRPLTLEALEDRVVPTTDFLYIGDGGDNTVQRFDADSGDHLGTFVHGGKSLKGPRAVLFDGDGHLLVANQNVGRGKPGEILQYDATTGAFLGALVGFQDANAPYAPRGMVLQDGVLYVASFAEGATTKAGTPDGRVAMYDAATGDFLGDLTPPDLPGSYNPRGIVFGPDGMLYVSVFDSSNPAAGYILQFDVAADTSSIFAFNNGDAIADPGETADLHRPEGLVFGPDGFLYVTSFRLDATDTDKILIFEGAIAAAAIDLDAVGQPRAFAQAILFGPDGALFVPITGFGPDTGAVRQYVQDEFGDWSYTNFVAPGTLGEPWYLTFGNTNPATLAYDDAGDTSLALAALYAAD